MQPTHIDARGDATIPVTEEQLEVGRRVVEIEATLRLRKQVEQVPVQADTSVIREFVDVRRVPVGRVIDAPMGVRHEGEVMVVPVVEERLVTRKELVLVEELHLTRHREVREDQAEFTLRRERVVVERLDPETQQWRAEDPA